MQHPLCDGQEAAEKAVNEVWESCFRDTRPFDEVCLRNGRKLTFDSFTRQTLDITCIIDIA